MAAGTGATRSRPRIDTMPELPEVETVRRGLEELVRKGTRIEHVDVRRRDLRAPVPKNLARRLEGEKLIGFGRWGKYLLWTTPGVTLLCHLGMSGTWRAAPTGDEREHDHCYVSLAGGLRLAYRDPRRFGLLDLIEPGGEASHPTLASLGPDPLDERSFTPACLKLAFAGRRAPVKVLIMDQRLIAGLGNIYAAEALHRAGIRPRAAAGRLGMARLERLVVAIREVLIEAIASGGSSIRDFRLTGGGSGYFQHQFRVYGREGEPCLSCGATIQGAVLGGRASAWCPACQR